MFVPKKTIDQTVKEAKTCAQNLALKQPLRILFENE